MVEKVLNLCSRTKQINKKKDLFKYEQVFYLNNIIFSSVEMKFIEKYQYSTPVEIAISAILKIVH
jgi:hypothetical protein